MVGWEATVTKAVFSTIFRVSFGPPGMVVTAEVMVATTRNEVKAPVSTYGRSMVTLAYMIMPSPDVTIDMPGGTGTDTENFRFFPDPYSVWCVNPPTVFPFSSVRQGLATERPSTCLMTVPGGTTARVRGDTPKPPGLVTITAPAVFPIPAITTDTIRDTLGLSVSPSPLFLTGGVDQETLNDLAV